jgi:hypothetical protein
MKVKEGMGMECTQDLLSLSHTNASLLPFTHTRKESRSHAALSISSRPLVAPGLSPGQGPQRTQAQGEPKVGGGTQWSDGEEAGAGASHEQSLAGPPNTKKRAHTRHHHRHCRHRPAGKQSTRRPFEHN